MGDRRPTSRPFTCVTCEIEITGPATFHVGLPFCCAGCVAGGPCNCSYDDVIVDPAVRHCLDVEGAPRLPAEARDERLLVSSNR